MLAAYDAALRAADYRPVERMGAWTAYRRYLVDELGIDNPAPQRGRVEPAATGAGERLTGGFEDDAFPPRRGRTVRLGSHGIVV